MSMDANDFVQLVLLAYGGKIRGKTKLQKVVYFLGVLTGLIDELGYRAHYYGPYSEEVAHALSRLTVLDLVDHTVAGTGAVNEFGFEVGRSDYGLNDDGRKVAELKAKKYGAEANKLREAIEKLREAGDLDYMKLPVAAKTHYMLETGGRATVTDLVQAAQRFGWKVTEQEVREAGEYLQNLELVEVVDAV